MVLFKGTFAIYSLSVSTKLLDRIYMIDLAFCVRSLQYSMFSFIIFVKYLTGTPVVAILLSPFFLRVYFRFAGRSGII